MSDKPENSTQAAEEARASGECGPCAAFAAEAAEADQKAGGNAIPLPKVDFSTFVLSLASSALMHLGEVPNPETGQSQPVDLQLAKHTIDVICMLQDKATNGMDDEEKRLLEGLLYELRMKYVIKAK